MIGAVASGRHSALPSLGKQCWNLVQLVFNLTAVKVGPCFSINDSVNVSNSKYLFFGNHAHFP